MERSCGILNIRPLELRDIDAILVIQSACPEIAQWTAWDYERVVRGEMVGWAAQQGTQLSGFLVARLVVGDLEILNLAVSAGARRQGVGTLLFRAALEWGGLIQAETAILEVRSSNLGALRFYERHNFRVSSRRPNYYTAPIDDALLLTAVLR
jgi:ribosomal-protein-alanine N-acetyltransferase